MLFHILLGLFELIKTLFTSPSLFRAIVIVIVASIIVYFALEYIIIRYVPKDKRKSIQSIINELIKFVLG